MFRITCDKFEYKVTTYEYFETYDTIDEVKERLEEMEASTRSYGPRYADIEVWQKIEL